MKIFAYRVNSDQEESFQAWARENNAEIVTTPDNLTLENVHLVEGFDGVTCSQSAPFEEGVYAKLKEYNIKQIAQRSTGYDNYNLEQARQYGIIITNVPSYSPESIAEYTLGMALALIRKFPMIISRAKEYDFRWGSDIQAGVIGEMTIGIIGTGHIGRTVAKFFKALGSKIIAYDLYPNEEAKAYLEYKNSVEEVAKEADIITLHAPATIDNYHQFGEEMFKLMKPTAYLINAARGSLVDTKALLNALDKGEIAGAALDTYEAEAGYIQNDLTGKKIEDDVFEILLQHPKIIFTPHIAFHTDVSERNIIKIALDSVKEVIETGDSVNRVN